nr:cytochrome P450 2J6-like [Lytechinus pictus]
MELCYLLLSGVLCLLIAWFIKHLISRPKNLPPGPTGFINVAWQLFSKGSSDPLALFSSWAKKYGEIVSFYVGTKTIVILNSYPVIVEAFRHPDLQDRLQSQLLQEILGLKNCGMKSFHFGSMDYMAIQSPSSDIASSFSKIQLIGCINDLFYAGSETTTTTLKWCILFMMAYPKVQSRVQDELDHVVGRERTPRLDDMKDLPCTNAVLLEVQRMGSIAPLGVPHVAAADTNIRGYTIPKGAVIVSNIYEVLNSEDLWTDPSDFKPERFLTADGDLINREELIFFGTGRRVCLGEQLARMETFLGFTSLLQRFTFQKPDSSPTLSFDGILGFTRNPLPYQTRAVVRV